MSEPFGKTRGYPHEMQLQGPPEAGPELVRADRLGRPRFWRDALRRRLLAGADLGAAAAASLVIASTSADAFWALVLLPGWVRAREADRPLRPRPRRDPPSDRRRARSDRRLGGGRGGLSRADPAADARGPGRARGCGRRLDRGRAQRLLLRGGARWIWRRDHPARGHRGPWRRRPRRDDPAQARALPRHAPRAHRRAPDRGLRRARRKRRPRHLRLRPDGAGRGRRPRLAVPRAPGQAERDLAASRAGGAGAPLARGRPAGARVRDLGSLALDGDDQARLRHHSFRRSGWSSPRRCSR